jgi:hypothetical protein
MSINSISAPYPVFTDIDGDPLESGYIYIGEPNLNPKVNTKQTYFNRDMSIPAAQPIRTVGGYPSYNGSPAVLYVDGDYSITVENKNQAFIYSAAVATNILGSLNSYDSIGDLIGYTAALENTSVNVTGYHTANDGGGGIFNWSSTTDKSTANAGTIIDPSVALDVQGTGVGTGCWVRQYSGAVNVKWFGAKGDGVTNDTVAIQSAHDFCVNAGSVLKFEAKIYLSDPLVFSSELVIDGSGVQDVYSYQSGHYFGTTLLINGIAGADCLSFSKSGLTSFSKGGAIRNLTVINNSDVNIRSVINTSGVLVRTYQNVHAESLFENEGAGWLVVPINNAGVFSGGHYSLYDNCFSQGAKCSSALSIQSISGYEGANSSQFIAGRFVGKHTSLLVDSSISDGINNISFFN